MDYKRKMPTVLWSEGLRQCVLTYLVLGLLLNYTVLVVCVSADTKQRRLGSGRELQASLPL